MKQRRVGNRRTSGALRRTTTSARGALRPHRHAPLPPVSRQQRRGVLLLLLRRRRQLQEGRQPAGAAIAAAAAAAAAAAVAARAQCPLARASSGTQLMRPTCGG